MSSQRGDSIRKQATDMMNKVRRMSRSAMSPSIPEGDADGTSRLIHKLTDRITVMTLQNSNLEATIVETQKALEDAKRKLAVYQRKSDEIQNTINHRDANKEHFFLSVLGLKIKLGEKMGRMFEISPTQMWNLASQEKVEFQRYHEWIEKRLLNSKSAEEEWEIEQAEKQRVKAAAAKLLEKQKVKAPSSRESMYLHIENNGWKCPNTACLFPMNPATNDWCLICNEARPDLDAEIKNKTWKCRSILCGFHLNPMNEEQCLACQNFTKGEDYEDEVYSDDEDEYEDEEVVDEDGLVTKLRTRTRGLSSMGFGGAQAAGRWMCPMCTFPFNVEDDRSCAACKEQRPGNVRASVVIGGNASPEVLSISNWVCLSCSFPMNIDIDEECAACHVERRAQAGSSRRRISMNSPGNSSANSPQRSQRKRLGGNWACQACTFPMNIDDDEECAACHAPRGDEDVTDFKEEEAPITSKIVLGSAASPVKSRSSVKQPVGMPVDEVDEVDDDDDAPPGHWKCDACKFPLNPDDLDICGGCEAAKK